jgi:hypothetical protein
MAAATPLGITLPRRQPGACGCDSHRRSINLPQVATCGFFVPQGASGQANDFL